MDWFRSRFRPDLYDHLKTEPHHPYQLDFVSAKHPRGDDITRQDFLCHLADRDDRHFFDAVHSNKLICLRLHKSTIPLWAADCQVVNIVIDPASQRWLHRVRTVKMFGKEHDKFISKENHPEFLKAKYHRLAFQNPYAFSMTSTRFIRDFVIGEPTLVVFKSDQQILADASNSVCRQQIMINLSDLFDWQRFHTAMQQIYQRLQLGHIDSDLVEECWQHYHQFHIRPILEKKIAVFGLGVDL